MLMLVRSRVVSEHNRSSLNVCCRDRKQRHGFISSASNANRQSAEGSWLSLVRVGYQLFMINPIQILRQRLNTAMQDCGSTLTSKTEAVRDIIACSALFHYLTHGLDQACNVYEDALKTFRDNAEEPTVLEELAFEDYAKLLYEHSRLGAFKPGLLRELLERAMERFPSNTIFLALYGMNEARTQVEGRVRRFLDDAIRG